MLFRSNSAIAFKVKKCYNALFKTLILTVAYKIYWINCEIMHQLFSLSPYIYVSRRNIPNFGLQILVDICSLSRLCQVNSIVSRPNRHLGICVANKTSNFGCNVINFQQGVEHIRTFTSVKLKTIV